MNVYQFAIARTFAQMRKDRRKMTPEEKRLIARLRAEVGRYEAKEAREENEAYD